MHINRDTPFTTNFNLITKQRALKTQISIRCSATVASYRTYLCYVPLIQLVSDKAGNNCTQLIVSSKISVLKRYSLIGDDEG